MLHKKERPSLLVTGAVKTISCNCMDNTAQFPVCQVNLSNSSDSFGESYIKSSANERHESGGALRPPPLNSMPFDAEKISASAVSALAFWRIMAEGRGSNTPPYPSRRGQAKAVGGSPPISVICKNLETIYFGVFVNVKCVQEMLEGFRERAVAEDVSLVVNLGGRAFELQPRGARMYRYRLTSADFTLLVASAFQKGKDGIEREKVFDTNPPIYIELSAAYTWREGYLNAVCGVLSWIEGVFGKIEKTVISRVDLTVDLAGLDFVKEDIERFVTYARRRKINIEKNEEVVIENWGLNTTGFRLGSGSLMCRVYDKTKEILVHWGKDWFRTLWLQNGWSGEGKVWRVEFQVRREKLKEFGMNDVENSIKSIQSLFNYLVCDWLSFRDHGEQKNNRRWVVSEWWNVLRGVNFQWFGDLKLGAEQRGASAERYERSAIGFVLGYAAELGLTVPQAFDILRQRTMSLPDLRERMAKKNIRQAAAKPILRIV